MHQLPPLSAATEMMSLVVHDEEAPGAALAAVAAAALVAVPVAALVGVSLEVDRRLQLAHFTDGIDARLDPWPYDGGDGPSAETFLTATVHHIDDARTDGRFMGFRAACAARDVLSVVSVPLLARSRPIGVLDLFATDAHAFEPDVLSTAVALSRPAAVTLANAISYSEAVAVASQLNEAMASRAEIEQAKGIVMHLHDVDAETAFAWLAKESMDRNVKVRDLAQSIVRRRHLDT